jgi:hypothetical protein
MSLVLYEGMKTPIPLRQVVPLTGDQFNEMLAAYPERKYPKRFAGLKFVVGDVQLPAGLTCLPPHVDFSGNLDARFVKLTSFSGVVQGEATFAGCKSLTSFSHGTEFHGSLGVQESGLTTFNNAVSGNLDISGCRDLEIIGVGARVEGNLSSSNCPKLTTFLGYVGGHAYFRDCTSLVHVSERSHVGGMADLTGTAIPEGTFNKLPMAAARSSRSASLPVNLPKRVSYLDALHHAGVGLPLSSKRGVVER